MQNRDLIRENTKLKAKLDFYQGTMVFIGTVLFLAFAGWLIR